MRQKQLDLLFQTVDNIGDILILPHNNPDPDAIACAAALRHLLAQKAGMEGYIGYSGIIGRAENKSLVRYLQNPLLPLSHPKFHQPLPAALVDVQPDAGNIILPSTATVMIVIDHHTRRETTTEPGFVDIRPDVGATSTILAGYFQTANIALPTKLATALFYGIKTNTMGLGRNAGPADTAAYYHLQPQIDAGALAKIEQARLPPHYFKSFNLALQSTRVYNGVVISFLGPMDYPELAAELADLLLRLEESRWVICMGLYKGELILSVRTRHRQPTAGQLVQAIVGEGGTAGGHGTMAGGQVPLKGRDPAQLARQLGRRALQYLDVAPEMAGKPLI